MKRHIDAVINVKIVTMAERDFERGYVRIEGGVFSEVGDMADYSPRAGETVTDGAGMTLYPGFIDAHCHIGMWEDSLCFEGEDGNEYTDPVTPHLRAIDAVNPMDKSFREALLAGVTTVIIGPGSANPIGGQLFAMKTSGICVDEMVIKAPVAVKFALGENPKMIYNDKNQAPMTRMATAAIIREQLHKAKRYLCNKTKAEENPSDYDLPEYDAKCEALIPLLKREIPAHIHAHRADDIFTAIRIAKEFDIDHTIVHATEGHLIADKLRLERVDTLSGPILTDRSKPELANLSTKTPGVLANNGVRMGIITDHPETPIQYLPLCAALAVRDGMDEYEALKAITINPAQICNIADRVGSISEGKDADLVVFDGSPFDVMKKPTLVMCGGKIENKIM